MSQKGARSTMCSLRRNAALLFWLAVTYKLKCLFTGSAAKQEYVKFCLFFFSVCVICPWFMLLMDFKREALTDTEYIKQYIYHGSPRKMTLLLRKKSQWKSEKCRSTEWRKGWGLSQDPRTLGWQLAFLRFTVSGWNPAETCNQLKLQGNDNENTKGLRWVCRWWYTTKWDADS